MTIHAHDSPTGDAELIAAVRDGQMAAYGELYSRHLGAARAFAQRLTTSSAEADDAVAEAFAKVLEMLQSGRGPEDAFRPYLLSAVRNQVFSRARHVKRVHPTDDLDRHDVGEPFVDPVEAELERSMVTQAFRTLPDRWQATLWHTAVEEQSPHEVARILGTTPNNVTSLAYRAREGLRQAYLGCYLADHPESPCADQIPKLGAYVRGGLGRRAERGVRQHVESCATCAGLVRELDELSSSMRSVVAPAVVGASVLGYLADQGAGPVVPWVETAAHGSPAWIGWTTKVAGVGLAAVAVLPFALNVGEPHDAVPPQAIETPTPGGPPTAPRTAPPTPTATPSATPPSASPSAPSPARPQRPRGGAGQAPTEASPPPPETSTSPRPRPSTRPTARPSRAPVEAAEPDPEVGLRIGDPVEEFGRTTVPLTVVNRTGADGPMVVDVRLPEMTHLDPAASGPCFVSGAGRDARLDCGSLADGASHDVAVAVLPDDNGDGTFSEQQGDLHAAATVERTRTEASRFVRVVC